MDNGRRSKNLFAIVWLKRGIVIETETSVLPSAAEAIAAAKPRADDVARRHFGQEPDTFRLMDATGKGHFGARASAKGRGWWPARRAERTKRGPQPPNRVDPGSGLPARLRFCECLFELIDPLLKC